MDSEDDCANSEGLPNLVYDGDDSRDKALDSALLSSAVPFGETAPENKVSIRLWSRRTNFMPTQR